MTDVLKQYQGDAVSVAFSGTRTLVSLDNDEWTHLSDEIANSGNYPFADFEFVCTSVAFAGADSAIEVYLVPTVDGTNYPDWAGDGVTDEQEHNVHFVGAFVTSGATAAQRLSLRDIELPAGKFKVGVRNRGGIALAASGSTLKYRPWVYKSA